MPTPPTATLPIRGSKGTPEGWRGAGGILWWSKLQTPQSSPGGSQREPIPRTTPQALGIITGREEPGHSTMGTQQGEPREHSHAMALPACLAQPPGTSLLPKSNPGPPWPRSSPVPPARLREHPTASLPGKQEANKPSALKGASSPRSPMRNI